MYLMNKAKAISDAWNDGWEVKADVSPIFNPLPGIKKLTQESNWSLSHSQLRYLQIILERSLRKRLRFSDAHNKLNSIVNYKLKRSY